METKKREKMKSMSQLVREKKDKKEQIKTYQDMGEIISDTINQKLKGYNIQVSVPPIKMPEIPTPEVTVNVPEIKIPETKIPAPRVTVKVPAMKMPEEKKCPRIVKEKYFYDESGELTAISEEYEDGTSRRADFKGDEVTYEYA